MEKLIAGIVHIEESAQALVGEARKNAAGFDLDLRQKTEELRREYDAMAEERLAKIREAEENAGAARAKEQGIQFEINLAALLEKRERNMDRWVEDNFTRLIRPETGE